MHLDHLVYTFFFVLFFRLALIPGSGQEDRCYGAYMTEDKVGLIIMPLDGNPHNSMALIAHPSGVCHLTFQSGCDEWIQSSFICWQHTPGAQDLRWVVSFTQHQKPNNLSCISFSRPCAVVHLCHSLQFWRIWTPQHSVTKQLVQLFSAICCFPPLTV